MSSSRERPSLDTVIEKIEEALTVLISVRSTSTAADSSMIELLMHKLKSGIPYYQRTAAREISLLSCYNIDNRIIFAKAGAIPLLTDLLTVADSRTQEQALAALYWLSIPDENIGIIVSFGALPGIVQVLKEGSMKAREKAANTLLNLSVLDENRADIGAVGAIPPLLLLLNEGTSSEKESILNVLCSLCVYEGNRTRAVRAGAVHMLIELLKERQGCIDIGIAVIKFLCLISLCREGLVAIRKAEVVRILVEAIGIGYTPAEPQSDIQELAIDFLETLSLYPDGKVAIGEAEVVPFLVEAIGSGSSKSKENAAKVLVELGSLDQKYLVEAQEHGVTGKLMDMLQHGTESEKSAAHDLLEMMSMV
ncbi:hypothetical protein L2E82_29850 [Cichorium intybus]|uniref:Uncharacterized protein n=1 Tax=Cichorium intybus TaxID=13427 RepID=A0ACB9CYZ9_CICIN|nr:hypothetical protein L2E82_29850 [Cichorium intybus]